MTGSEAAPILHGNEAICQDSVCFCRSTELANAGQFWDGSSAPHKTLLMQMLDYPNLFFYVPFLRISVVLMVA